MARKTLSKRAFVDPRSDYWKIRATMPVALTPVRLSIANVLYAFVFAVLAATAAANFGLAWWLGVRRLAWWLGVRRLSGLLLSSVLGGGIPGAWLFSASSALGTGASGRAQRILTGASTGAAVGLLVGAAVLWGVRRAARR